MSPFTGDVLELVACGHGLKTRGDRKSLFLGRHQSTQERACMGQRGPQYFRPYWWKEARKSDGYWATCVLTLDNRFKSWSSDNSFSKAGIYWYGSFNSYKYDTYRYFYLYMLTNLIITTFLKDATYMMSVTYICFQVSLWLSRWRSSDFDS